MGTTVQKAIIIGIVAGVAIWGWKRLKRIELNEKIKNSVRKSPRNNI